MCDKHRMEYLIKKHGICMDCGELFEHHYDEPFASCKCVTSEWGSNYTPHMESHKPVLSPTVLS